MCSKSSEHRVQPYCLSHQFMQCQDAEDSRSQNPLPLLRRAVITMVERSILDAVYGRGMERECQLNRPVPLNRS